MGIVGRITYSEVRYEGYPIDETIYYVYCDKCGSFKD